MLFYFIKNYEGANGIPHRFPYSMDVLTDEALKDLKIKYKKRIIAEEKAICLGGDEYLVITKSQFSQNALALMNEAMPTRISYQFFAGDYVYYMEGRCTYYGYVTKVSEDGKEITINVNGKQIKKNNFKLTLKSPRTREEPMILDGLLDVK